MRLIAMTGLCLCVGACVTAQKPSAPVSLSATDAGTIQTSVRAALKDPDSARFGRMAAAKQGGEETWVCGFVNGRNSLGAYTGEQPFIGMLALSAFVTIKIGGDAAERSAIVELCQEYGVRL